MDVRVGIWGSFRGIAVHRERDTSIVRNAEENGGRGCQGDRRQSSDVRRGKSRKIACVCVAEYLSLTTVRGFDDRKKQESTEGAREAQREKITGESKRDSPGRWKSFYVDEFGGRELLRAN